MSAGDCRQDNLEERFRSGEGIGMGLGIGPSVSLERLQSIMMATLTMVAALGLWFSASAIKIGRRDKI